MTRIINLRQARKSRARAAKRAEGDANAARFGEAKPLRAAREAEAHRVERVLDGHRAGPQPDDHPARHASQGHRAERVPGAPFPDADGPDRSDMRMTSDRTPPDGAEGPGTGHRRRGPGGTADHPKDGDR